MPLKDRLFTGLCLVGALAVVVLGFSRGNARAGLIGAAVLLGYAVLQTVSRRLTPGARLLTGDEADGREQLAHYRATRTAGQAAIGLAAVGAAGSWSTDWQAGLWVAGTALVLVLVFVAVLLWQGRR